MWANTTTELYSPPPIFALYERGNGGITDIWGKNHV